MGDGVIMDDDEHLMSSGPPASRTVIDNLKRLLTQRQHSRESDAENKEVVPSTGSDLESDLSFYSLFTSTSSDSDLDYLHTSPERRKNGKRRPKRNVSTSSTSSSASLSPVRERRKRPKTAKRSGVSPKPKMIVMDNWSMKKSLHSPMSQLQGNVEHALGGNGSIVNLNILMNPNVQMEQGDDDNLSSSNKESMTEDEDIDQGSVNGNTKVEKHSGLRLRKTKRDRNRRRNRKAQRLHHSIALIPKSHDDRFSEALAAICPDSPSIQTLQNESTESNKSVDSVSAHQIIPKIEKAQEGQVNDKTSYMLQTGANKPAPAIKQSSNSEPEL